MTSERSPRIVQLTPPGRGAIASLLVDGPGAVRCVETVFRSANGKRLESLDVERPILGRVDLGSQAAEEAVLRRRPDGSIELNCHGGHAVLAAIQDRLVDRGARPVSWREWAADRHADPLTAAARVTLADARTERTATILLDQFNGALRHSVDTIKRLLDSTESPNIAAAVAELETLLGRAALGRHLTRPWRVVLAGPANVGKSSLVNAIVGYQRALVHHAPGTTRDVVTASTAVDGWPIELCDTAGLRDVEPGLERAGIELTEASLSGADLAVLVFDASCPFPNEHRPLVRRHPEALLVDNKSDLEPIRKGGQAPRGNCFPFVRHGSARSQSPFSDRLLVSSDDESALTSEVIRTSALEGQGIESLVGAIAERLVPDPPPPQAAVPFTDEQIERLTAAADWLRSGDLESGIRALP